MTTTTYKSQRSLSTLVPRKKLSMHNFSLFNINLIDTNKNIFIGNIIITTRTQLKVVNSGSVCENIEDQELKMEQEIKSPESHHPRVDQMRKVCTKTTCTVWFFQVGWHIIISAFSSDIVPYGLQRLLNDIFIVTKMIEQWNHTVCNFNFREWQRNPWKPQNCTPIRYIFRIGTQRVFPCLYRHRK